VAGEGGAETGYAHGVCFCLKTESLLFKQNRSLLIAFYKEGMRQRDIAEELGITEVTIRAWMRYLKLKPLGHRKSVSMQNMKEDTK